MSMKKILVAIAGNANDAFALQEIVRRFEHDTAMEVHLAHVELPLSGDIAHHSSRESRKGYHDESADKALAPARAMLDRHSIPYAQHVVMGHPAEQLTALARRLHCEEIVMATRRKSALARLVESSVTDKVLQITTVPVEVVAGAPMAGWERYGIPAAVGAALAATAAMVID